MDVCYLSGRHGDAIYDCSNRDLLLRVLVGKNLADSSAGKLLVEKGYEQWPPGSRLVIHISIVGELVRMDDGILAFKILEVRNITSSK